MGHALYIIVAFPCTVGAIALAIYHIYLHLLNYTEPNYQRYTVRIIFMVPVYALTSFLSLAETENVAIYSNSIRDIYEAWVIYNFLSLCLDWVGGPGAAVLGLSGRVLKPSWWLMTCCFVPIPLDGRFIRSAGESYLYLTIIYTFSYSTALCALYLFYAACRDLLQPFNPVPKFIIIKSVVFLTYWQGVMFFLAAKTGYIKDAEEAAEFQNFILCVEMFLAAMGHYYAFPHKEYSDANIGISRGFSESLAHALMINDFYHDTVHQFAPSYHDYVLYNHNECEEGATKYRARTFVPTGQEMDMVRKNKHMLGIKIDDLRLSNGSSGTDTPRGAQNISKSAESKNSLLRESSSFSVPYETPLIDLDQ
ncbi:Transmembrane protein 184a [Heracleum sosnowskyi]|uniref:Transmembrane protein 184a n=1 Tax=Heracleum sosnowskyi TaxID=360622 RepID=A0AAD8H4R8_9APIA|nr:Transmembrane protein 184a [Heracleum sosnowskyi]